jgi:hypothetical protein
MASPKNKAKSDGAAKALATTRNRDARKIRQEKRDGAAVKKVLRRAAEGNVSWNAKSNEKGGLFIISCKGGNRKLLRGMVNKGLLRVVDGKKLVPVA